MDMDPGYYMIGMHAYWWIFWAITLGAFVLGAYWRAAKLGGASHEVPQDVLRRRLASGEIEVDEYEQRISLLNRDV